MRDGQHAIGQAHLRQRAQVAARGQQARQPVFHHRMAEIQRPYGFRGHPGQIGQRQQAPRATGLPYLKRIMGVNARDLDSGGQQRQGGLRDPVRVIDGDRPASCQIRGENGQFLRRPRMGQGLVGHIAAGSRVKGLNAKHDACSIPLRA